MTLAIVIGNLATRIGTEFKAIRTLVGGTATSGVASLTTTATHLVGAINEVKATADAAAVASTGLINDVGTSTSSVWSSSNTNSQIGSQITAAVNAAIDGAPGALDTLNELAAALGDDASFSTTVTTALGNRLRYDAAQSLTTPQQLQACQNIGVGDPQTNFVTTFNAALV